MISQSASFNEAALQGRLDFLNTGAGLVRVRVYATARPASGGVPGESHLVEIALADPAGSVAANALTLAPGSDALIGNTGVAVWARVVNGNGDFAFDCDVRITAAQAALLGVPERAGEITLSSVQLYAGGLVRMLSAVLG